MKTSDTNKCQKSTLKQPSLKQFGRYVCHNWNIWEMQTLYFNLSRFQENLILISAPQAHLYNLGQDFVCSLRCHPVLVVPSCGWDLEETVERILSVLCVSCEWWHPGGRAMLAPFLPQRSHGRRVGQFLQC